MRSWQSASADPLSRLSFSKKEEGLLSFYEGTLLARTPEVVK
jgi:hypothetical protein